MKPVITRGVKLSKTPSPKTPQQIDDQAPVQVISSPFTPQARQPSDRTPRLLNVYGVGRDFPRGMVCMEKLLVILIVFLGYVMLRLMVYFVSRVMAIMACTVVCLKRINIV